MPTASKVFNDLHQRGFTLTVDDGRLQVTPRTGLTADDTAAIIANKLELLALLEPPIARPYLTDDNELRIPFTAHPRFHYWAGGQSIWQTLAELRAPLATWKRHAYADADLLTEKHTARCDGSVQHNDEMSFCVTCGYYLEAEAARRARIEARQMEAAL